MRVYKDLEQGTQGWLEARRGILTASVIGRLITGKTLKPAINDTARGVTASLVAERITGMVEPFFATRDMERGTFEEPIIRDIYATKVAPEATVSEVGFITEVFNGNTLGYSPDGLVDDDGLIEIKSRLPKKHLQTILADSVPVENMAQCQTGLLVTGRAWLDYVSFCGGMPLYVKRVLPDERWFNSITETLATFENTAHEMASVYASVTANSIPTEPTAFNAEIEIY